ncbi:hypothetical protein CQA37_09805 [Helicobacter sp. MIT 99-10781]|uniref:hypothetical protein n=1 Tax=Helicobacter sp. MIT 99-10781 TaxID=1332285 RepID=UPI000E204326|nr:hypothetical protein [Helicobacter sp. MIT 99-10781]RDU51314.1 hypothetical protein CQA37_09805 [Helicobacter sp. MIT 99-10781]
MKIQLARLFRTKPRKSFGYAQKVRALQLFLTFAQTRRTILEFSKWHKPTKKGSECSRSWRQSGIYFREVGSGGGACKGNALASDI